MIVPMIDQALAQARLLIGADPQHGGVKPPERAKFVDEAKGRTFWRVPAREWRRLLNEALPRVGLVLVTESETLTGGDLTVTFSLTHVGCGDTRTLTRAEPLPPAKSRSMGKQWAHTRAVNAVARTLLWQWDDEDEAADDAEDDAEKVQREDRAPRPRGQRPTRATRAANTLAGVLTGQVGEPAIELGQAEQEQEEQRAAEAEKAAEERAQPSKPVADPDWLSSRRPPQRTPRLTLPVSSPAGGSSAVEESSPAPEPVPPGQGASAERDPSWRKPAEGEARCEVRNPGPYGARCRFVAGHALCPAGVDGHAPELDDVTEPPRRVVRLLREVVEDFAPLAQVEGRDVATGARGLHVARSNPHGALWIATSGGDLGIKPDEFEDLGEAPACRCGAWAARVEGERDHRGRMIFACERGHSFGGPGFEPRPTPEEREALTRLAATEREALTRLAATAREALTRLAATARRNAGLPDEEGPDDWRSRVSPEVAARYDALDAEEAAEEPEHRCPRCNETIVDTEGEVCGLCVETPGRCAECDVPLAADSTECPDPECPSNERQGTAAEALEALVGDDEDGDEDGAEPEGWCGRVGAPGVRCATCDRTKAPLGRSVSPETPMCDDDCAGYRDEPKPDQLWPGERCAPPLCQHRAPGPDVRCVSCEEPISGEPADEEDGGPLCSGCAGGPDASDHAARERWRARKARESAPLAEPTPEQVQVVGQVAERALSPRHGNPERRARGAKWAARTSHRARGEGPGLCAECGRPVVAGQYYRDGVKRRASDDPRALLSRRGLPIGVAHSDPCVRLLEEGIDPRAEEATSA